MRQVIAILTLFSFCFVGRAPNMRADEAIRILDNTHEAQFSKSITFRLQVEAQSEIDEVTLYYRLVGEGLRVKVPIPTAAGKNAFAHTWELEPGEVPVGARIEYDWRIVDEAGNELQSSAATFEYEDARFSWEMVEESNIILFWYGSSEEEARRLLGYATQSLARLQDEMGVTLDQPVRIYVYWSKSDMSLALPQTSEAYDERILTLGVVVDEATLLLLGSHRDVEGTIAHELSHIVVGLATDNAYASPPRWLDEGLAMYAEGKLPAANRRALESAIQRDQLISVRSLSGYTGDPSQVDLFYGEVYSLVEHLLQAHGKEKMTQLLDSFREGITQEEGLQRVYGFGLDELDAEWRMSLGLQPRGASSPAAPVTPRPVQRPCIPCPGALLGGLLSVTIVACLGKRRARAS
jgi:hypothetical protein